MRNVPCNSIGIGSRQIPTNLEPVVSSIERFKQFVSTERLRLVKGGEKEGIDPFNIYPLDPVSRKYVFTELVKAPGYGVTCDLDFADSLLSFKPEVHLDERFSNIPLLISKNRKPREYFLVSGH